METLNHTNRLIANLDVDGSVYLLRHQMYRAEELQRTIEEKNDLVKACSTSYNLSNSLKQTLKKSLILESLDHSRSVVMYYTPAHFSELECVHYYWVVMYTHAVLLAH